MFSYRGRSPGTYFRSLVIFLVFGGGMLVWELGIKASMAKGEEYQGTLVRKIEKRKWHKRFSMEIDSRRRRYYDFYWEVKCDDGETRTVEVPWGVHRLGEKGDPIRKVKGKRWPEVATPEADEARKIKEKVLGDLFN